MPVSLRCTYCHDALPRDEAAYCAGCLAPHHEPCFAEHGACSVLGCEETGIVTPKRAGAPEAPVVVPVATSTKSRPLLTPERRVSYSCAECSREFKAKVGKLVDQLAANRSTCAVCGGKLTLPPGVHEVFAARVAEGALLKVERVPCVFCLRDETFPGGDREQIVTCGTCGVDFRPGLQPGRPSRLPPLDEERAGFEDLIELEGFSDLGDVAQILEVRALVGELALADAQAVVRNLALVLNYRPSPHNRLLFPVERAEAEPLLEAILFAGKPAVVDPDSDELVYVIDTKKRTTGTAFDLALILMAPSAPLYLSQSTRAVHQVRIALDEIPGEGVQLRLRVQVNDEEKQPAPNRVVTHVGGVLSRQRPVLEAYFGLRALFGSVATGHRAFAATHKAIKQRIDALGGELAKRSSRIAERLCPTRVARTL